jgi:hypothetical protein
MPGYLSEFLMGALGGLTSLAFLILLNTLVRWAGTDDEDDDDSGETFPPQSLPNGQSPLRHF